MQETVSQTLFLGIPGLDILAKEIPAFLKQTTEDRLHLFYFVLEGKWKEMIEIQLSSIHLFI